MVIHWSSSCCMAFGGGAGLPSFATSFRGVGGVHNPCALDGASFPLSCCRNRSLTCSRNSFAVVCVKVGPGRCMGLGPGQCPAVGLGQSASSTRAAERLGPEGPEEAKNVAVWPRGQEWAKGMVAGHWEGSECHTRHTKQFVMSDPSPLHLVLGTWRGCSDFHFKVGGGGGSMESPCWTPNPPKISGFNGGGRQGRGGPRRQNGGRGIERGGGHLLRVRVHQR